MQSLPKLLIRIFNINLCQWIWIKILQPMIWWSFYFQSPIVFLLYFDIIQYSPSCVGIILILQEISFFEIILEWFHLHNVLIQQQWSKFLLYYIWYFIFLLPTEYWFWVEKRRNYLSNYIANISIFVYFERNDNFCFIWLLIDKWDLLGLFLNFL